MGNVHQHPRPKVLHTWVESHCICILVTGLFHLPLCLQGPSMFAAGVRISFLFKSEYYSVISICYILPVHSFSAKYLRCVLILATMKNTAISIGIQNQVPAFSSFVHIPRNRITGSYNSMINFLRNYHVVFHFTVCTIYTLHQFTLPSAVHRDSNFSTASPTLVIFCMFYNSHFNGMKTTNDFW